MATKEKNTNTELEVEEIVSRSEQFIENNSKKIIYGIIAIALVVGAVLGIKHGYMIPQQKKAAAAIFKGEQYFGADNFETALNGDSIGYKGFLKVADEFSGTAAGNLANAYAGICYAQLGKYEDAVKYLDKFSAKDQLVSPAILGTIGNCYAEMGQLDKAAGTLLKAADKADSQALSPIYLIQAGQLFEKLGKNSEAVKAYTLVKEKYFNSYQSMDIDKYIERASIK